MNWLQEYTLYLQGSGRSDRTVEAYLCDLRVFGRWFEEVNAEELQPERITPTDCMDFRRFELDVQKLAPSTWNRRRASLIVLSDWALSKGYLNIDPMEGVEAKAAVETPPRWLDESEYRALVRHLDQEINRALSDYEMRTALMYRALAALMLYAGLRVAEACALQRSDLTIGERSGKVVVRSGKGEKQREVPLNLKARKAIGAWLEWTEKPGLPLPLWHGRKGDPLGTRSVQNFFQELSRVLEIEDLTPHALRHTFVKRQVDAGVPMSWIQKLAGHSSAQTTARYARPGWSDLQSAVEML